MNEALQLIYNNILIAGGIAFAAGLAPTLLNRLHTHKVLRRKLEMEAQQRAAEATQLELKLPPSSRVVTGQFPEPMQRR